MVTAGPLQGEYLKRMVMSEYKPRPNRAIVQFKSVSVQNLLHS